jgi:hypothetical protein
MMIADDCFDNLFIGGKLFSRQWRNVSATAGSNTIDSSMKCCILISVTSVQYPSISTSVQSSSRSDASEHFFPTLLKLNVSLKKMDDYELHSHIMETAGELKSSINQTMETIDAEGQLSNDSHISQEDIMSQIIQTFEKCWFNVNQKFLLQVLLETQLASPLLILPPIKADTTQPGMSQKSVTPKAEDASTKSRDFNDVSTSTKMSTKDNMIPPRNIQNRPPLPSLTSLIKPRVKRSDSINSSSIPNNATSMDTSKKPTTPVRHTSDASTKTNSTELDIAFSIGNHEETKFFTAGLFACPCQGEVTCAIYSGASLTHDAIVRSLETLALSQFMVTNNERYFVSQVQIK